MTALIDTLARLVRTTAFRVIGLYVALFALAAAGLGAAILAQTNALLTETVVRELAAERDRIVAIDRAEGLAAVVTIVVERARDPQRRLYMVVDANGRKIAGNLNRWPPEIGEGGGGLFQFAGNGAVPGGELLAAGLSAPLSQGARIAVGRNVESERLLAERMRAMFLWSLALLAGIGVAGGILASRVMLKRVEAINRTARSIMGGDLSQRVSLVGSGDEMDELAGGLNAMLDRIEQLMRGMREVSDNIAHDLKTPLNRLRNHVESALRDPRGSEAWQSGLERALDEADDIIRTFNALLLIARLEAGALQESMQLVDLSALVDGVGELYEPLAEERGLALDVHADPGCLVQANRELVGQALANLIDNAIKYSTGTSATDPIVVRVVARAGGCEVSVADRGPGVPPQDRQRVQRRFVRLEASRSQPGTGLGLSLVAAVARLHGGALKLEDNEPGLRVRLVLPAATPAQVAEVAVQPDFERGKGDTPRHAIHG